MCSAHYGCPFGRICHGPSSGRFLSCCLPSRDLRTPPASGPLLRSLLTAFAVYPKQSQPLLARLRSAKLENPADFLAHGIRRMAIDKAIPVCKQPGWFYQSPHCSSLMNIIPRYFLDCNHKNQANDRPQTIQKNIIHIKLSKRTQQLEQLYSCHK